MNKNRCVLTHLLRLGIMKEKIGIATVTTGLNYGTSLQAFSTKNILSKLGYKAELIKIKGSFIKGRDIRLNKMFIMFFRSFLYKKNLFKLFVRGKKKSVSKETKKRFFEFNEQYLFPQSYTWRSLKKVGLDEDYKAFLCGSDQVWNGTTLYPDPLYYLEFAPEHKRIAFSPSFGCSEIPKYNKKIIANKISKFSAISTREEVGCEIVKDLTGKQVISLVDPTLMIDKKEWCRLFSLNERIITSPYILVYFLDEPTSKAKEYIRKLKEHFSIEIIGIPYDFINNISDKTIDSGPEEFLNLVYNAEYVVTDSFHGTAFALNFDVSFTTFDRNYGKHINQSSRITSLLNKVDRINRFEPSSIQLDDENYDSIHAFLNKERSKAINYLTKSIK